jgi:hypothetical protein
MARRTAVLMIAATLLTATAAAWPLPVVFKTLGIVKKKAPPQSG